MANEDLYELLEEIIMRLKATESEVRQLKSELEALRKKRKKG